MLTSLPLDFEPAVHEAAALGFSQVDVIALAERPDSHREVLADTGLLVSCAAVGRGLAVGKTLDASAAAVRREALEAMKRQVADAASLGATHCYVIPGMDGSAEGLIRFGEACAMLADFAAQRMVRLCVEHIPGRALPTAVATLAWLDEIGQGRLGLLLDVGHCLMSSEDPAGIIAQAGPRLGYVHLDDNDGRSDLHWPLLTGCLTEPSLCAVLAALRKQGYAGALALELNPAGADPNTALGKDKALVERLAGITMKGRS
jgi:sugar phosphate isomerase/epimerase